LGKVSASDHYFGNVERRLFRKYYLHFGLTVVCKFKKKFAQPNICTYICKRTVAQ